MQRQLDDRGGTRSARRVDDRRRRVERAISTLASGQHGLATRQQLLGLGLGPGAIDSRVRAGSLRPVHRGVYLIGYAPIRGRVRELAAVLACGPSAVLSHRSAAAFWGLLGHPASADVSVTVATRHVANRSGIRVHRARALPSRDRVTRDGIPVTRPARTLLDLATVVSDRELEGAIAEAQTRRMVSERHLLDQLQRNPGRAGSRALRRLLEIGEGPAPTRSEAERRMLRLLREARLPAPEVNARVGNHEVDFLWRGQRLVVEVDGFRFHSSRRDFEQDRVRDAEHAASGYSVIRVTWRQLVDSPTAVIARIAAALARRQ